MNNYLNQYQKPSDKKYAYDQSIHYQNNVLEDHNYEEVSTFKKYPMSGYVLGSLLLVILLFGTAYAIFNYDKTDSRQADMAAGEVYLKLDGGTPSLSLSSVYPRTTSEARERNDNYVDFTLLGKNTSTKQAVLYEITLQNGEEVTGKTRINPNYLIFDLSILDGNDNETLIIDSLDYNEFNAIDTRAVNNIPINTTSEIEKKYRLRMWLSDAVTISDSDNSATYTSSELNNLYANVNLHVSTEMTNRSLPMTVNANKTNVENGVSFIRTTISNNHLLEENGELLVEDDVIEYEITNPSNLLYFSYIDTKGNVDTNNNESLDLTYTFNRNEEITLKVFTKSRNDANVKTTIHFKISKNGEVIDEYNQVVEVVGSNYCLNNGFTNLANCLLVTENLSNNVADAKSFIASKGAPDVNNTAPIYAYEYTVSDTLTTNIPITSGIINSSFNYISTSGKFFFTNTPNNVPLENVSVGDYVGVSCSYFAYHEYTCPSAYKIVNIHLDTHTIDAYTLESHEVSVIDGEVGLYRVPEFNNQSSYVYRGDVKNNNVYFGGYYWKIVRLNGDGSIRLLYNGTTLAQDGNKNAGASTGIGSKKFNNNWVGPAYVGYMYGESDTPTESSSILSSNNNSTSSYYWGDDYERVLDANGEPAFRLKSSNYPMVSMTTVEMKTAMAVDNNSQSVTQLSLTPYTCLSTSSSGICNVLLKASSISASYQVEAKRITMSPLSVELTQQNDKSSTVKKMLDDWYASTFSIKLNNNKSVTNYIYDGIFCNERGVPSGTTGGGFSASVRVDYTDYYTLRRNEIKTASLTCRKNDAFSVNETTISNGDLTYPVGLITADEVALAGGKYDVLNQKYYLKNGGSYATMTPSSYNSIDYYPLIYQVVANGGLGSARTDYALSIRPVINLKADTLINSGDGTTGNPYIID